MKFIHNDWLHVSYIVNDNHQSYDNSEIDFVGFGSVHLFSVAFELQLLFAVVVVEPKNPQVRPRLQTDTEVVRSRFSVMPGEAELD